MYKPGWSYQKKYNILKNVMNIKLVLAKHQKESRKL